MFCVLFLKLKDMAERLPIGTARNSNSPPIGSLSPISRDTSSPAIGQFCSPVAHQEMDPIQSNSSMAYDVLRTSSNNTSGSTDIVHSEVIARNKNKAAKVETTNVDEWVEQDEPGVYITFVTLPGGLKDLKRVRFRYVS